MNEMKIFNKDLYMAIMSINKLSTLKGGKFVVTLYKAINKVRFELDALEEIRKKGDDYKLYEVALKELQEKYSDKDTNGKSIIKDGIVIITKDIKLFDKYFEELKLKYNKCILEQKDKDKEFEKLVNEESEYIRIKLKEIHLPKDISVEQYEIIQLLLDIV